jgi:hypothetical protein
MKPAEFHPDAAEEAREAATHYEDIQAGLGTDFQAELDVALIAGLTGQRIIAAILTGRRDPNCKNDRATITATRRGQPHPTPRQTPAALPRKARRLCLERPLVGPGTHTFPIP